MLEGDIDKVLESIVNKLKSKSDDIVTIGGDEYIKGIMNLLPLWQEIMEPLMETYNTNINSYIIMEDSIVNCIIDKMFPCYTVTYKHLKLWTDIENYFTENRKDEKNDSHVNIILSEMHDSKWFKNILLPTLDVPSLIVMDNNRAGIQYKSDWFRWKKIHFRHDMYNALILSTIIGFKNINDHRRYDVTYFIQTFTLDPYEYLRLRTTPSEDETCIVYNAELRQISYGTYVDGDWVFLQDYPKFNNDDFILASRDLYIDDPAQSAFATWDSDMKLFKVTYPNIPRTEDYNWYRVLMFKRNIDDYGF
jgi:hypothetical protein